MHGPDAGHHPGCRHQRSRPYQEAEGRQQKPPPGPTPEPGLFAFGHCYDLPQSKALYYNIHDAATEFVDTHYSNNGCPLLELNWNFWGLEEVGGCPLLEQGGSVGPNQVRGLGASGLVGARYGGGAWWLGAFVSRLVAWLPTTISVKLPIGLSG